MLAICIVSCHGVPAVVPLPCCVVTIGCASFCKALAAWEDFTEVNSLEICGVFRSTILCKALVSVCAVS